MSLYLYSLDHLCLVNQSYHNLPTSKQKMLDDNANTLTHPLQLHANIDTWKKFTCNMFDPRCYKKVKCVCSYQPAKYLMEKSLTLFLPLYTYFDTIVSIF